MLQLLEIPIFCRCFYRSQKFSYENSPLEIHGESLAKSEAGMFTLFRCFTEACENYEGDPIPEQLYLEKLGCMTSKNVLCFLRY